MGRGDEGQGKEEQLALVLLPGGVAAGRILTWAAPVGSWSHTSTFWEHREKKHNLVGVLLIYPQEQPFFLQLLSFITFSTSTLLSSN